MTISVTMSTLNQHGRTSEVVLQSGVKSISSKMATSVPSTPTDFSNIDPFLKFGDYGFDTLKDTDEALTAEFRAKMGLLSEDDEGLTEAFKAHLGLTGLDGINEVVEIEMAQDWMKDDTIAPFKFARFAKEKFQGGVNHCHTKEALAVPLLPKKHDVDQLASLAVWLAIQRFMGDAPQAEGTPPKRERVPVMTKIYRTIEAHAHRKSAKLHNVAGSNKNGNTAKSEFESFKSGKSSSFKKLIGRMGSSTEKSNGERRLSQSERRLSQSERRHSQTEKKDIKDVKQKDNAFVDSGPSTEYSSERNVMLDRIPGHEMDIIHFIVGHGILRKDMRDEIFSQLLKQLTKNPSKTSQHKGWMMLAMCVGCFLPSEQFIRYVKCFIKDAPVDFKDSYATYTKDILRRTLINGTRYHPPNWLELQATKLRKYVMVPVTFADGRNETLEADSATTAAELCQKLANKVGLKDQFGFSIYICIYDKVSSLGSGLDHVMDAISECEQVVRAKGQREEEAPWRLFFRKELFSPWHDPSYDDMSTQLVYQQFTKGFKSREYRCKNDEDLAQLAAQIYFIDNNGTIVPGKLQQTIQNIISTKYITPEKTRDFWTQMIISNVESMNLSKMPIQKIKEDLTALAANRWALQFSGLFEAFKISGPSLPKNDVVVAINHKGLYVMHEPFKVCVSMDYHQIVDIYCSRTTKMRGQSFSLVTVKGEEFVFMSPNAQNIASLVSTFLEGLRRRSRYAVGLQEFMIQTERGPFVFKQGDILKMMETEPENAPKKHDWIHGQNLRTGQTGNFPLDMVYIIPSPDKPPDAFLNLFSRMTSQETATLPRRKGSVMLGKGETIGRHGTKGKETIA